MNESWWQVQSGHVFKWRTETIHKNAVNQESNWDIDTSGVLKCSLDTHVSLIPVIQAAYCVQ